jgi:DNA-binding GntR family transcriptional regulator
MVYLRVEGRIMERPVDLGEADPRLYVRLAARLRRQILDGEVAPGQRVPSITALSQEFRCARQTCGKAVRLLEQEGLLTFIPGLGYHTMAAGEVPSRGTS